jgi:hypothetical protein
MANVFGAGTSGGSNRGTLPSPSQRVNSSPSGGGCGSGVGTLPSPKQQVVAAQNVASNPNVFRSTDPRGETVNSKDFYTRRELDKYLDAKADISSVYSKLETYAKTEVDNKISGLNISTYALSTYVDSEVSSSFSSVTSYVATNYYLKTQLYTKTEIDSLVDSASLGNSYLSKGPASISDITITPINGALPVSLIVQSSNNLDTTQVQRWENNSTDHLASIYADGKFIVSNYVSIGENVNSDAAALSINERRIENLAEPINELDAVNKTYMERFITTTIDDVLTDSDENYLIDALEY